MFLWNSKNKKSLCAPSDNFWLLAGSHPVVMKTRRRPNVQFVNATGISKSKLFSDWNIHVILSQSRHFYENKLIVNNTLTISRKLILTWKAIITPLLPIKSLHDQRKSPSWTEEDIGHVDDVLYSCQLDHVICLCRTLGRWQNLQLLARLKVRNHIMNFIRRFRVGWSSWSEKSANVFWKIGSHGSLIQSTFWIITVLISSISLHFNLI